MSHRTFNLAAFAIVLTSACVGTAFAFSTNALVGQWFTEIEEKDTYLGQPYTIRRQVEDNRPDGTKTATFHFFDNCRYIGELVNVLSWGVDTSPKGSVYWTKCISITQGGVNTACATVSLYDLTAVTDTFLKYTSRDTGRAYAMTRVDASFKIPPSACLSEVPRATPVAWR
jgi:hypothetical protein